MVIKKILTTSSKREICIFDNLLGVADIIEYKTIAQRLSYNLSNNVDPLMEHKQNTFFTHVLNNETIRNFNVFQHLNRLLPEFYENRLVNKAWVNATFSTNRYPTHSDTSDIFEYSSKSITDCHTITTLIYLTLKWDKLDGGETLFCDDYGNTEIAIEFVPHRVVIFDSLIPHRVGLSYPNPNEPRICLVFTCVKVDNN
jgi:hypothetical protein